MDNSEGEFWVQDRIQKIRQIIGQYGAENFSISFSGGKDSCVLSALIDEALPGNAIPRVYANTGIEYNSMVRFVRGLAEQDERIVIVNAGVNIKKMLDTDGYPFKSKQHSYNLSVYQHSGMTPYIKKYVLGLPPYDQRFKCPPQLRYQFTPNFSLKVSDKCCKRLKVAPIVQYAVENRKSWRITGLVKAEGGRRMSTKCVVLAKRTSYQSAFNPLIPVGLDWIDWYIKSRNITLCELYYEPYCCNRTGCKGCPFKPNLQRHLDMLARLLPAERRQCERIWKPVYDEYRRIGYRLRQQLSLDDLQFLQSE